MHVMFVLHSFFSIIGAAGILVIGAALLSAGFTLLALTMIFFGRVLKIMMPTIIGAVAVLAFASLAALSTMSWGAFALLAPIVALSAHVAWTARKEDMRAPKVVPPPPPKSQGTLDQEELTALWAKARAVACTLEDYARMDALEEKRLAHFRALGQLRPADSLCVERA